MIKHLSLKDDTEERQQKINVIGSELEIYILGYIPQEPQSLNDGGH